jgi:hypothetical protein
MGKSTNQVWEWLRDDKLHMDIEKVLLAAYLTGVIHE